MESKGNSKHLCKTCSNLGVILVACDQGSYGHEEPCPECERRETERREGYVHPDEGTERAMRSAKNRRSLGEELTKHFEDSLPPPAEKPYPPKFEDFKGIGNADAFLAAKANYVLLLERHVDYLRSCCIAGFYEDEVPQFEQGYPYHEIQSLVTAEEVQKYVNRIKELLDASSVPPANAAELPEEPKYLPGLPETYAYIDALKQIIAADKAEIAQIKEILEHDEDEFHERVTLAQTAQSWVDSNRNKIRDLAIWMRRAELAESALSAKEARLAEKAEDAALLSQLADEVMKHQWSNSREAMTALHNLMQALPKADAARKESHERI